MFLASPPPEEENRLVALALFYCLVRLISNSSHYDGWRTSSISGRRRKPEPRGKLSAGTLAQVTLRWKRDLRSSLAIWLLLRDEEGWGVASLVALAGSVEEKRVVHTSSDAPLSLKRGTASRLYN